MPDGLVVTVGCVRAAHGPKSQPHAQHQGSRVHQVTNRFSVLTCLARNKQRLGRWSGQPGDRMNRHLDAVAS